MAARYLQERNKALEAFKVLAEQLADPQSSQYLRFKVERLGKENAEMPKLLERVEGMQGEHNELVQFRHSSAMLQEKLEAADKASQQLSQLQVAHKNMKTELSRLKKSAGFTEALETKDKLHKANCMNEELQTAIKRLKAELERTQSILDNGNDLSVWVISDDKAPAAGTDQDEN